MRIDAAPDMAMPNERREPVDSGLVESAIRVQPVATAWEVEPHIPNTHLVDEPFTHVCKCLIETVPVTGYGRRLTRYLDLVRVGVVLQASISPFRRNSFVVSIETGIIPIITTEDPRSTPNGSAGRERSRMIAVGLWNTTAQIARGFR